MSEPEPDFCGVADASSFYEDRYRAGYMQDWPGAKLDRVAEVVRELRLPPTGRFLDFGCGTGVFTELLTRVLPGWSASGAEIVESALKEASERCPQARFVRLEELSEPFDFVFSHHVLEHVADLPGTLSLMASLCRPGGSMLNILPCGNAGSLEHQICASIRGGIDRTHGNRFFFEDEGHLQRLTSAELSTAFEQVGVTSVKALYANHYYGALRWLTEKTPVWLRSTIDPKKGIDDAAVRFLDTTRKRVLRLRFLRRPPSLLIRGMEWRLGKAHRSVLESAALVASNPLTIGSPLVERWLSRAEAAEWATRQNDPRGSEMFLIGSRSESADNAKLSV